MAPEKGTRALSVFTHMGSTLTTVLAARLPNDEAATVRDLANQYGVTVTQAIRVLLNHSLRDLGAANGKVSDDDRR